MKSASIGIRQSKKLGQLAASAHTINKLLVLSCMAAHQLDSSCARLQAVEISLRNDRKHIVLYQAEDMFSPIICAPSDWSLWNRRGAPQCK